MAARRKYTLNKPCEHEGCTEVGHWSFDTRQEYINGERSHRNYKCLRHSNADEVLSVDKTQTEVVMVLKKSGVCKDGLYWDGSSGFAHGPGFMAWAKDFPEGTKLIVTARIEST